MGCSSSTNKDKEKNEFFKEAMGFRKKNIKGFHVDTEYSSNKTQLGTLGFEEADIDHADESSAVKPWLEYISAPAKVLDSDLDYPKYNLKLEHVFGFNIENTRKDLFYLSRDELIYISSSLAIIQNIDDYSQTIFGGFPIKEERECHDNMITSLAFYKSDVSMVATGQRGLKPKILVWSPIDTEVMFAEFTQPKGSKEVSRLEFGKNAQYLASFGRDDKNSFYVYDLRTKELLYSDETGENDYLFDLAFNPLKDEVCLVGVRKIIFGYITNKSKNNVYKSNTLKIFTTVNYTSKGECLIGTESGEILIYENNSHKKTLNIAEGGIQTITHKEIFKKIYVADSLGMIYLLKDHGEYEVIEEFQIESPVRALDVNEDEDLVLGLKNGCIKIKKLKDSTKTETVFLKSHSTGSIGGLDFIPECRAITTGEDNKILLWNLRSKKCEAVGTINPLTLNEAAKYESEKYILTAANKSGVVSYNNTKEHIAIGINNGMVSIRNGIKDLNVRLKNIKIGEEKVCELKYTNYGDLLIATSLDGFIKIMETNEYQTISELQLTGAAITNLDWDLTNSYIQCVTNKAQYIFISVTDDIKIINEPESINTVDWPQVTCKFGYNVQGVYLGSTDPDYISSVCKAHSKKLVLSGNDDYLLNLTNYPAIQESAKFKSYRGHSGKIKRIVWSPDDESILTIADDDLSVILWKLEQV